MRRLASFITKTLSFRLSLMVIAALATLLMVALLVMFVFSRKAVKEEALKNAEQTLEATVQHIDNILLSVEQSSGNIYWKIISQLHNPDMVEKYTRKLVECNPYISDCKIEWITDSNRQPSDSLPPTAAPCFWTDPLKEADDYTGAVTSFCLPVFDGQKKVGTIAVDVPLAQLSKIVLEAKPSPNSFSTLLGKNGSYIVHPDSNKLNQNVIALAKKEVSLSVTEAAQAMLTGKTGYKYVKLQGKDYYVFYKPFKRAAVPGRAITDLGWSAGIIYPEEDIFGTYNRLLYTVLIIAVIGMLLLLLLCRWFIHGQLLPLQELAKSAGHIADGCYDEPIPDNRQQDEVGRLHYHFQNMQQSLSAHMSEMQRLTDTLKEQGDVLQATYEQSQVADRMKTNFLYNMSDQMMQPVKGICESVRTISSHSSQLTKEETNEMTDEIQRQGEKVTALLNQLIADSEKLIT